MKYIIWDWEYDGYNISNYDDFEKAKNAVKELCEQRNLKIQYKNWCLGKTNSIQFSDGKIYGVNFEIFITSDYLNKELK